MKRNKDNRAEFVVKNVFLGNTKLEDLLIDIVEKKLFKGELDCWNNVPQK